MEFNSLEDYLLLTDCVLKTVRCRTNYKKTAVGESLGPPRIPCPLVDWNIK